MMLNTVGFEGEMSINLDVFSLVVVCFVLFAVNNDLGFFSSSLFIPSHFHFPFFFLCRKLLVVSTLIRISSKLTQVVFNEMFLFIFYDLSITVY